MTRPKMKFFLARNNIFTAFMIVFMCGIGNVAEAKIKCWENNEGIRECGNSVPPEFAQKGHEELSDSGVTVDSKKRAKSLEELEAEHTAAREQADAAARKREQTAKDRVLLDTFTTDDDMLLARDGQVTHLESQIRLTESHTEKLNHGLEELIQEAADHERRGNEPPEKLIGDIDSLRRQIRDNEAFVKTKQEERVELFKKFEKDIAHFRKLKGYTD